LALILPAFWQEARTGAALSSADDEGQYRNKREMHGA
jgi:hypothetical protein